MTSFYVHEPNSFDKNQARVLIEKFIADEYQLEVKNADTYVLIAFCKGFFEIQTDDGVYAKLNDSPDCLHASYEKLKKYLDSRIEFYDKNKVGFARELPAKVLCDFIEYETNLFDKDCSIDVIKPGRNGIIRDGGIVTVRE